MNTQVPAFTEHNESTFNVLTDTTGTRIPYKQFRGGGLRMVSGSTATITWYSATYVGGTVGAVKDGAGGAVTSTVATGQCIPIPPECYGFEQLLPVGDAAGVFEWVVKA